MAYQKNIKNDYKPEGLELIDMIITNVNQINNNNNNTVMSSNLVLQLINNVETSTSNQALRNRVNTLEERIELLELVIHNLQNNN